MQMHYKRIIRALFMSLAATLFVTFFSLGSALAQTNSFKQTNLTSDTAGLAAIRIGTGEPWALPFSQGNPSGLRQQLGFSTLYNRRG